MTSRRMMKAGLAIGLAASFHIAMAQVQLAQQRGAVDPRVQQRTYLFADTNEQMPYALFASSKVSKDKKNPLIISLHGLGGTQDTMVRESLRSVQLAEEGGYILVTPMGYNCGGWYGIPAGAPRGGGGLACPGGGTAVTDNAKVRELSEKDVMTVLDTMRKEFNVDERRIYIMGHSMGGSGTLYLASKYPQIWAAAAPIAPPGAGGPGVAESLGMSKLPTFVVQGDADTAVPVAGTRAFIDRLKAQNAVYEYLEIPGATHNITGIPEIYKFFEKHSKPVR